MHHLYRCFTLKYQHSLSPGPFFAFECEVREMPGEGEAKANKVKRCLLFFAALLCILC